MKALILSVLLTSCTSVKYTDPSGASYHRLSVLNNKAVGSLRIFDGTREFKLNGYLDDTASAASDIAKELAPLVSKAILP